MTRYPALNVWAPGRPGWGLGSPWKCENGVVGESVSLAVVIDIRSQPGDPSMKPVVFPPSDPDAVRACQRPALPGLQFSYSDPLAPGKGSPLA